MYLSFMGNASVVLLLKGGSEIFCYTNLPSLSKERLLFLLRDIPTMNRLFIAGLLQILIRASSYQHLKFAAFEIIIALSKFKHLKIMLSRAIVLHPKIHKLISIGIS